MSARALQAVEGRRAPRGWEELWSRDRWRQRELPHGDLTIINDREVVLAFDGLIQPWLKEAAKRWVRARMLTASSPSTMLSYLRDVRAFSRWLADTAPEVTAPSAISRELLREYAEWVGAQSAWSQSTRHRRLSALRSFLQEQCEDGLAGLPRTAAIHAADIPRVDARPPRGLDKALFDQLVDGGNLALLRSELQRTAIVLLAYTGMRVSSLVVLRRDALEFGSDGHPYLRYRNVKLSREAVIPIAPSTAEQLQRHERYLCDSYPDGTDWLLPSHRTGSGPGRGRGGAFHILTQRVRDLLHDYVRRADIRDADGNLATWIHPHLFRHHLGTSMVNDGVPLPVIQRVFDHATMTMTARYAQLHDDTLRREIMRWHERVNIRGERIALPIDGPLGEAACMKERIARARQALPNGYCGLPLVQDCPHPNACLSCDNFLTDSSFRTIHKQQLQHTRELRERAADRQNLRLVDVLQRDERSLTRILDGLDALDDGRDEPNTPQQLDILQLASAQHPNDSAGT